MSKPLYKLFRMNETISVYGCQMYQYPSSYTVRHHMIVNTMDMHL